MRTVATLRKQFDAHRLHHPIEPLAAITDAGLVLGAGTQLVRMEGGQSAQSELALAQDEARLFALLAVAFRRPASPNILRHIEDAFSHWRRGDKALANIHLAFARLPRLEDETDAWCLHLAAWMLDDGYSPRRLLRELGYLSPPARFQKYDPDQPRVPAGSGRESGQWTSGNAGGVGDAVGASTHIDPSDGQRPSGTNTAAAVAALTSDIEFPSGSLAEGLFDRVMISRFLEGLAAMAPGIGLGVVLGAAFLPVSTRGTTEGKVPGDPNTRYAFNKDEGVLRLTHRDPSGEEIVIIAHGDPNGIFREIETGTPIARMIGHSLVFDAQSLDFEDTQSSAVGSAGTRSKSRAKSKETDEVDHPRLCPDPGPDVPHGASEISIVYQAYISWLNNPQRPLPPGIAVSLINPLTGKAVTYDDCRETDGTMIEAKGPGFAKLLKDPKIKDRLTERWTKQAMSQVSASGGRAIEWYFADESAANYAKDIFENSEALKNIRVLVKPMNWDFFEAMKRNGFKPMEWDDAP